MTSRSAMLAATFADVRDMPYATNAAFDASSLLELGAGNCVAKSQLLVERLREVGVTARIVRWKYRLIDPHASLLGVEFDIHAAAQARIGGTWVTVDPTHDSALPDPPFVVATWDGATDTDVAYEPESPVWIDGVDDEERLAAWREIAVRLDAAAGARYSELFNAWLVAQRGSTRPACTE